MDSLKELFKGYRLIQQLLGSREYYDDIQKGIRMGYTPQQISGMYMDYFKETGIKTFIDKSGKRINLDY